MLVTAFARNESVRDSLSQSSSFSLGDLSRVAWLEVSAKAITPAVRSSTGYAEPCGGHLLNCYPGGCGVCEGL